jgi:thymidine kinase
MGFLTIIIGPMYSGKTEKLIDLYNEIKFIKQNDNSYIECSEKLLAINYDKDTRYGVNKIISHNKKEIDCISINNLEELLYTQNDKEKLYTAKYIFINEAQFFKNLKNWVLTQIEEYDKNIILCGLDSDFKRDKFGEILDLIPHADQLIKLYGKCSKCNNKSLYTYRLTSETNQEVIGSDNYIPVCRNCYNILNN